MSIFEYQATRKLVSTHQDNSIYTLNQAMSQIDPSARENSDQGVALSGDTETLLHRVDEIWTVTTTPMNDLPDGEYELFREFALSVMDGQYFYFDPYGNGNEVRVTAVKGSYQLQRTNPIRGTGAKAWVASIAIREVNET